MAGRLERPQHPGDFTEISADDFVSALSKLRADFGGNSTRIPELCTHDDATPTLPMIWLLVILIALLALRCLARHALRNVRGD